MPTCTRCGKEDAASGTPRWCKKCRAEYQRDYQDTVREMANKKGFAEGARAYREMVVSKLRKVRPDAQMSVGELIAWLRREPLPNESDAVGDGKSST